MGCSCVIRVSCVMFGFFAKNSTGHFHHTYVRTPAMYQFDQKSSGFDEIDSPGSYSIQSLAGLLIHKSHIRTTAVNEFDSETSG
ncbi:unnamed protein product [Callosobruchus maculatus]|uniref:Uncharacterized protein n=1 Tax=Callosobruchus maculatus TaxID=64391 RepID=A0A653DKL3_CALMS|nr:unnamed protein product [Callosobruchus maculatus]